MKTIALVGNQNCGKTTLFNTLTGANQRVGNFPGVTVEQKTGIVKGNKDLTLVDLPGIYSLSPFTQEEILTRDFLIKNKPDCIINIVDATNLERNLYLTLQLLKLDIPIVIALNMMDEMRANGNIIHVEKLAELLQVAVVPISASKKEGIPELIESATLVIKHNVKPLALDYCSGAVHRATNLVEHMIEDHSTEINVPTAFAATKIIEGDDLLIKSLNLSENEIDILGHTIDELQNEIGLDRDAAIATMRYDFIEKICAECVVKQNLHSRELLRSVKIDKILTHKVFALPIFLGIMLTIFYLSFDLIGGNLSKLLEFGLNALTNQVEIWLNALEVNIVVVDLIVNGIFMGIGTILSFMPIILVLFIFLSILEDSGYMARVAYIFDKILRKFGLSGRSFVPMLIGFGCSVPAIMAARTLGSDRDRKMTIFLIPFMSCSAKIPIYAFFSAVFFPNSAAFVMMGLYLLGIGIGVVCGLLMNKITFTGKSSPFMMELPPYRLPSLKSTTLLVWQKAKDFLVKAFTIIFVATIIIWALSSFDFRINFVTNSEESILAIIAKLIAPIFTPLGFGDWRAVTALIAGFSAKEAVITTLQVLLGDMGLANIFTSLSALSFLIFTLLYTPCLAAIAIAKKELGKVKDVVLLVVMQCVIAYVSSLIFYQIARLFPSSGAMWTLLIVVVLVILVVFASVIIHKNKKKGTLCCGGGGDCSNCMQLCDNKKDLKTKNKK